MKLISTKSKNADNDPCHNIYVDYGDHKAWIGEIYFKNAANQIAASGDLLEACERALDEIPIGRGDYLRSAINKAKGIK